MKPEKKNHAAAGNPVAAPQRIFLITSAILLAVLCALFWRSFDSDYVHFSNDGPLGAMKAEYVQAKGMLFGCWYSLNWIGSEGLAVSPGITTLLRILTTPEIYGRILYPFSMFVVGLAACFYFRRLKLTPLACILGGLAAGLNSDFISTSCWGVASQIVGFAALYVAMGLLASLDGPKTWLKVILAGFAVGVGIMEAYDIAALFSLVIAAYTIYQSLFMDERNPASAANLRKGFLRVGLIAIFSAFIATRTLSLLVGTQVAGIVGTGQDAQTKAAHWAEATQWSLPKTEALQLVVPGIFGYGMFAQDDTAYWGTIGASPVLDEVRAIQNNPRATEEQLAKAKNILGGNGIYWRFSGTGYYQGVLVLMVALWAAFQSFRGDNSPFSLFQRRAIWFWTPLTIICLLLSFGRFAPFYKFWYALPYASVIRNPTKFLHIFSWVMLILFAYGIHGIQLLYMRNSISRVSGVFAQFQIWLKRTSIFEKRFSLACLATPFVGFVAWMIYATKSDRLTKYISTLGIPGDQGTAASYATHSIQSVLWFAILAGTSAVLLALIFSGQFSGPRARIGGIMLGVVLLFDLGRAAYPWINYWNISYKYASNPIIDFLSDKPWEHRAELMPFGSRGQQFNLFRNVYDIEWHQQLFPFHDIQSLKVVMEPRVSVEKARYQEKLPYPSANVFFLTRNWELMNVRYLVGNGGQGFVNALNTQVDPGKARFRTVKLPGGQEAAFQLVPKPGTSGSALSDYTPVLVDPNSGDPNEMLGMVEFTGALPRAKLFSNWQINTNDEGTLNLLASPEFDPHQTVLVSSNDIPAAALTNTNLDAGEVTITKYLSKRVELEADVKVPSVLLLTDRFNPKWHVEVDGKPAEVLRCDYIMRGVYLTPGKHHVIYRFIVPSGTLYVSLFAIGIAILLAAWVIFSKDPESPAVSATKEV